MFQALAKETEGCKSHENLVTATVNGEEGTTGQICRDLRGTVERPSDKQDRQQQQKLVEKSYLVPLEEGKIHLVECESYTIESTG